MSTGIGSFRVRAEPGEVAAFREATGLPGDHANVPLTYPMRWLVTPDIRAALLAMVPEPDLVLVHESQTFDYQRQLRCGADYVLSLAVRREAAPDRLFVDGMIADAEGLPFAAVETILRLFSTKAVAA